MKREICFFQRYFTETEHNSFNFFSMPKNGVKRKILDSILLQYY